MSNANFHAKLFNIMPVPRMVVKVCSDSCDFTVQDVNQKALEYFDYTREQIVGNALDTFLDPDSVSHFQQSFEVCVSRKMTVTVQALPGVLGKVRVHGFMISPVLDDDGEVAFLDVIAQPDIQDKSIVQRERDDAILLLTSIFDVSEIGIVVTDHTGRIVRVNDAFIRSYGWQRDELLNTEVSGLVTPDERELAKENHAMFIREARSTSGDMKIIRKDGSISNTLFTTGTLELSQGRRFQVTTVMDITLRKQMEHSLRMAKEQADAANRAKSTFLANMSHELRTPLNAIIGFSEMMQQETFGALGHNKYTEYIGDIHLSARHLLEIINEVLDMSKIESGRIELDEEMVDIRYSIESVTRMMASRAFDKQIKFVLKMPDEVPCIRADQRLFRQILINLVTNALKFSDEHQDIVISVDLMANGGLQIAVQDFGVGIPKEKIKQAMEPFGQVVDHAESNQQQGTGLGLPLAKAMAELHEGQLILESVLGEGTTAYVNIPEHRVFTPDGKRKVRNIKNIKANLAQ